MRLLRRTSHLLGWALIAAAGVVLILESTDVLGSRWRDETARAVDAVAFPTWPGWASALTGLGLGILGVLVVVAQFVPDRRGNTTMHHVHADHLGETKLAGRAAIAAVRHELEGIEGVVEVDPRIRAKTMQVELRIDDRADLTAVEQEARERLGHGFWIDLGVADFTVDILVTHHPNPPRVR